ncbi:hypothetical protein GCE65_15440 [Pseudactinotalea sp. HY158]|nr:hypothetical protein GCE65_15440 [Pseudactinotalea sp. HY158]
MRCCGPGEATMTEGVFFAITHRADQRYRRPVTSAYGRLLLTPRAGGGQRVHAAAVTIDPEPDRRQVRRDFHGNMSTFIQLTQPYDRLTISAESIVELTRRPPDPASLPRLSWEHTAQAVRTVLDAEGTGHAGSVSAALAVAESRLGSPLVTPSEEFREFAAPSFRPGRPLVDVAGELSMRVAGSVRIVPTARAGPQGASTALREATGTVNDAAHLLLAAARSMGLAARYLTGYRFDQASGAGELHAWASLWVPGGGWIHVDPSRGGFVDLDYVALGWGRDAWDVLPLRGVAYGSELAGRPEVEVTMRSLSPEEAAELAVGVRTGSR